MQNERNNTIDKPNFISETFDENVDDKQKRSEQALPIDTPSYDDTLRQNQHLIKRRYQDDIRNSKIFKSSFVVDNSPVASENCQNFDMRKRERINHSTIGPDHDKAFGRPGRTLFPLK